MALPVSVITLSSATHAQKATSVILKWRAEQIFRLIVVERQQSAAAIDSRSVDQVASTGFDEHQLDHAGIDTQAIHRLLVIPFIAIADAVIGTRKAGIEQVMGTHFTRFDQSLFQPQRPLSAPDHGEVFDKAFERFFRYHVGPWIRSLAWRNERALANVNE
ncbi:hypothetical protein D3C77_557070 [compost metagenome]